MEQIIQMMEINWSDEMRWNDCVMDEGGGGRGWINIITTSTETEVKFRTQFDVDLEEKNRVCECVCVQHKNHPQTDKNSM